MKTKVAWRCQEIFFFFAEWSLYIKSKWYIFSWGPSWQFLHNTSTADESRHCHDKYRSFFAATQQQMQKNGSFQSISLCSYFSLAALNWSKSKGRIMCKENWVGRLSPNVFAQFTFFCNLLDPVPCINPKELQHTLSSTYILKSGKTNINYVWGQIYLPLWTVCWMCYHKTFLFFIRIW